MKTETLIRYKVSEAEMIEKLGIKGKISFVTCGHDGYVIIEAVVKGD